MSALTNRTPGGGASGASDEAAAVRTRKGKVGSEGDVPGLSAAHAYAADPYSWALQQAGWLRERRFDALDVDFIADEIADVAHYLSDRLQSDLVRVLQHLLKWDSQAERRSRSGMLSVREHRRRIGNHLRKAPGLSALLPALVDDAFQSARNAVLAETGLPEDVLPDQCPYAWDAIMTRPIDWPQNP